MQPATTIMNKAYDQTSIDTLSWIRFPLIVGVILAHCNLPELIETWYGTAPTLPAWASFIFEKSYIYIFPARVPTLYFISGYFFFRGNNTYDRYFYIKKYKRRVYSLLIPYILWNAIALLLIWIRHKTQFHSNIPTNSGHIILDYLSGFWNFTYNKGFTANSPLWFMRDLMVVSLCAPILHFILQKKYWILSLALMCVAHIANLEIPLSGWNISAFFFFSIGATIAIHRIDITKIPHNVGITSLLFYLPISHFLLGLSESPWYLIMSFIAIIIKSIAVIYIVSLLFKKDILTPTPTLTRNSFFLFAFHGIMIGPIIKLLYILCNSNNPYILLGIYVVAPTITIIVAFTLRHILLKFIPLLGNLLSGNR